MNRLVSLSVMATALFASMATTGQLLCPSANAQEVKSQRTVSLSVAQLSSFETALHALSDQTGVAFIVEGGPIQPTLDGEQASASKPVNLPLAEAVEKVAALYDYDAHRVRKDSDDLWVLQKRYTDVRDLPQVTVGEIAAFMEDCLRILAPFNPHTPNILDPQGRVYPNDPHIADFAPTLTPEQLQQLQEKQLPVASLSPAQKQAIVKFAASFYVQRGDETVRESLSVWKQTSKGALGLGEGEQKGIFGVAGRDRYGRKDFQPLEYPAPTQFTLEGVKSKEVLPMDTPPSRPALQTLEAVTAALNARRDGADSPTYKVEALLAAKPVLLIGTDKQTPLQILTVLADVYGLRVRKNTEAGELWLARRPGVVPSNVAGIADAIMSAAPRPLLRAAQLKPIEFKPEPMPAPPNLPDGGKGMSPDELSRIEQEYGKKVFAWQERQRVKTSRGRAGLLKREAARRLRVVAEPRLTANPKARVPLSSLTEADQTAFALTQIEDFLDAVQVFGRGTPKYIARFEDLRLGGGPYREPDKSEWRYNLFLLLPDSGQGPGVGNMRYTPNP